eukprot:4529669-Lingulodinium_polyedra.AAC.1
MRGRSINSLVKPSSYGDPLRSPRQTNGAADLAVQDAVHIRLRKTTAACAVTGDGKVVARAQGRARKAG